MIGHLKGFEYKLQALFQLQDTLKVKTKKKDISSDKEMYSLVPFSTRCRLE